MSKQPKQHVLAGPGRPQEYFDDTVVCLHTTGAHKLQKNSDRRAIVDFIVEAGGQATLIEIDRHFGFDIRKTVTSLLRSGWLAVCFDPERELGEEAENGSEEHS